MQHVRFLRAYLPYRAGEVAHLPAKESERLKKSGVVADYVEADAVAVGPEATLEPEREPETVMPAGGKRKADLKRVDQASLLAGGDV